MRSALDTLRRGALGLCLLSAIVTVTAGAQAQSVPEPPARQTKLHSPAMVTAGGVLMGLFLTAGVGFIVAAKETEAPPNDCSGSFCLPSGDWGFESLGFEIGAIVSFGHALGLGLPLVVIGARRKPLSGQGAPPPLATIQFGPAMVRASW